ncbi:Fasciclin domain family protein [Rutstroemia sp. NJR-2017a BVV2]|nr:Fasciclin domain family protein [Rutstroemia sp. NJR-2017a BVV2]
MKLSNVLSITTVVASAFCINTSRQPLSYASVPNDTYVATKPAGVTTLLDFVKSREELSVLASLLSQLGGFTEAFDTAPGWKYTFFAPSNTAFSNTGTYFSTYLATPNGKFWLGNILQHHYVPNGQLKTSDFNVSYTRIQTGSYLYVGTQLLGSELMLNNVSKVTTGNLPVTSGIVHIVDHILDPSAQVFEADVAKTPQSFIPGSCSNPALPYC